jgi:hypothetical protein
MKKIMLIAVALMATMSVSAQQMFLKPMVGGTLATLTKVDDSKMKLGFGAGAEFGYQVAESFAVTAGALVSMQGAAFKDGNYYKDRKTTLTYLNVPILANYYIIPGLAIKAGIQPGFLLSAKAKGSEKVKGEWFDYENTGTDHMKTVDISIPIGLSYEISDFVIDARYNFGLTKVGDSGDAKNSVIMLTLGYKIPF